MKLLLLFANKSWETEPILTALTSPRFSSDKMILSPSMCINPWLLPQGVAMPRAIWNAYHGTQIELWCFQDIMDIADPNNKELYSSSEIKNNTIHKAFGFCSQTPDLVLALGTAAFGDETVNNNGCVVTGSGVFIHNFHPNGTNPNSKWDDPRFEQYIGSPITDDFFSLADTNTAGYIESRLLKPFNNPSSSIQILADKNYTALSIVNVTNYNDYATSDQAGIDACEKVA